MKHLFAVLALLLLPLSAAAAPLSFSDPVIDTDLPGNFGAPVLFNGRSFDDGGINDLDAVSVATAVNNPINGMKAF